MESTNLHQLQDQPPPVIFDTTSLSTPSCYGTGSSHSWSPQISFNRNAGNLNQILQQAAASRSRDSTQKKDIGVTPLNDSMIQDLGYHWASDAESCLSSSQTTTHDSDQQFRIKKEEISNTFPKFTPSSREHYRWLPPTTHITDALSEKLMLKTLSSGHFYSSSTVGGLGIPSRGNFSQIYPSINISNLNQSSPAASSTSLNVNMHSSYLLNSGDSSLPSQDGRQSISLHLDNMQHPVDRSSCNSCTYPSHFPNGMVEIKRASALLESKASESQTASKKLRLESRPSCPPLKVRKEKLGDRIAALQQLVAPFGKTDTASVLMEAIGYIKFLHNQVETLSVPYMKSSRNQNMRGMQGGSAKDEAGQEPKQDLRSRGLSLVPLSCLSCITGDGGAGLWQQPSFG